MRRRRRHRQSGLRARGRRGHSRGERRKWPFATSSHLLRRALPAGRARTAGHRRARRGDLRRADGPRRHQPRWRATRPRAVRAVERIGPMDMCGHPPAGRPQGRGRRRRALPLALLAGCHRGHRGAFRAVREGGRHRARCRRRPFDLAAILKALGRGRPSAWSTSTRTPTPRAYEGTSSTMAGRSGGAVGGACSIPTAPSRSASAAGQEYLWEFSHESGMTMIHADEIDRMGIDAVIAKGRAGDRRPPAMISSTWIRSTRPTPGTGSRRSAADAARRWRSCAA